MKRTIQILSVISGLVAVLAVVLNIQVLFGGNSWFFRFAMFSVAKNGGVMGYLGNLLSMIIVAAGFGGMCICGFRVAAGGGAFAPSVGLCPTPVGSGGFAVGEIPGAPPGKPEHKGAKRPTLISFWKPKGSEKQLCFAQITKSAAVDIPISKCNLVKGGIAGGLPAKL